jgi:hypothetical protein
MSFQIYPLFRGATPVVSGATNTVGDSTLGSFVGFIVGSLGSEPVPVITLFMLDGSTLPIHNVQPGVPYVIANRGVESVSTGMGEVHVLKG